MIVGKVVGSVVSTRKSEKLIGSKFMIIEPVHHMKGDLSQLVAIEREPVAAAALQVAEG